MKKVLSVVCLSLLLAACHSTSDELTHRPVVNQQTQTMVPDHHTAQTSLDWAGVYEGLFPCADCEGIQTQLTLTSDGQYTFDQHYLKNNQALSPRTVSGQFAFDPQQPSLIRLDEHADNYTFFVGENFVELRDTQTGEKLSDVLNYSLKKIQ